MTSGTHIRILYAAHYIAAVIVTYTAAAVSIPMWAGIVPLWSYLPAFLLYGAVLLVMAHASCTDILYRKIYNRDMAVLLVLILLFAVAFAVCFSWCLIPAASLKHKGEMMDGSSYLFGFGIYYCARHWRFVLLMALLIAAAAAFSRFLLRSKGSVIGGGDIKLLMLMSLRFGYGSCLMLMCACVLMAVFCLGYFLIRRLRLSGLPRYRLCFGPFLYISALAVSATCSLSFALHGDFGLSFDLFVV